MALGLEQDPCKCYLELPTKEMQGCITHPSTKLTSRLVPGLFLLDPCTIASHLDTLRNRWIRHKPYYRWQQHDSFMENCAVVGYKRHKPYYRWIQHDSFMKNCAVVGYKRHKPYYRWIQHDSFMQTCAVVGYKNDINHTIGGYNTIVS